MAANMSSSSSYASMRLSSPSQIMAKFKLSSRLPLFDRRHFDAESSSRVKVMQSSPIVHGKLTLNGISSKRKCIHFAISEDQQSSPSVDSELKNIPYEQIEGADGKSGFISFYGPNKQRKEEEKDEVFIPSRITNQNKLLWVVGPTVLVASFVFPSLYLRRILSSIFEDSLLTDFLILFFTEALFYCGVAIFLLLIDRMRRYKKGPTIYASTNTTNVVPHYGYRISSVAVLALSLIIPTVTMGFVWPWTGPAASATLAPYLVGIVVQFAFEQYAKYIGSPSWPAIPIVFQVYRLHQLNRAAQLVTALSFTVRGAETTPHNIAINASLTTLLNVLQFLGIVCIWSLSSFIGRYFPSSTAEL
ncbi:hypothetical protein ACP275_09G019400 [Erythranthe tilingii]